MKKAISLLIISASTLLHAQVGHVSTFEKVSDTQGNLQVNLISNSRFGYEVASIGDLNDDGVEDIAVGGHDVGYEGRVHILFMNSNGTVNSSATIGPNIGGLNGTFPYDMDGFGDAIDGLGDLNNDGTEDIIVGNQTGGQGGKGEFYIIFLNTNGTVNNYSCIMDGQGFTGNLPSGACLGWSVANIGDVNNDNVTDVAVGSPCAGYGSLWIFFLNSSATIIGQQEIGNAQGGFTGILASGSQFSNDITGMGDLNSDGVEDILVGAGADSSNTAAGVVYGSVWTLFLNSSGQVIQQQKISPGNGGFSDTLDIFSLFGEAVGNIGDIDGDGINDAIVGAAYQDEGGFDKGAAWILFMNSTGGINSSVKIAGQTNGFTPVIADEVEIGRGVCGIGDLNGDLRNDVVIGAPGDNDGGFKHGAIYILHLIGPTVLSVPGTFGNVQFNVYPNPVTGDNLVVHGDQSSATCNYSLLDISGRPVVRGTSASNNFMINTTGLPAGSYTLVLEADQQKEFHKVFIHQ